MMRFFHQRQRKRIGFYVLSIVIVLFFCNVIYFSLLDMQNWWSSTEEYQIGQDKDPEVRAKRNQVKQMMRHAWKGYVDYAWGFNELKPVSRQPHNESIFGIAPLGATIVDSLDTLLIMGMTDEFLMARDWVQHQFNPESVDELLSLFEINIRFLGGLLSAYALTGDVLFRDKARLLGEKMLPAFNTETGLPGGRISLAKGWSSGGSSVLAEWGTLSLEFNQLAEATHSESFSQPIKRIAQMINDLEIEEGLFPVQVDVKKKKKRTPRPGLQMNSFQHYTLGAMADSFYEYLLKSWIQSGREDEQSRQLYLNSVIGIRNKLLRTSEQSNLTYLADMQWGQVQHKMDHLACFAGGMLALGGHTMNREEDIQLGAALTATCHQAYDRTTTKLGPEAFRFSSTSEAVAAAGEKHHILRPEVIESYFILWRITKDNRYRQWGWEAVQALEKYCRIKSGGYSGIRDVYSSHPTHDDVQQSFFLAETLKYLYLLFSDSSFFSLDQWVFNTEAHPLPIHGAVKNPPFLYKLKDK